MNMLSNLFWLDKKNFTIEEIRSIKKELTVIQDGGKYGFGGEKTYEYYDDRPDHIGVPRQMVDSFKAFGHDDRRIKMRKWEGEYTWNSKYGLIEIKERDQVKFVAELLDGLKKNDVGAIGQASAGFGKTVCGAWIALQLGLKVVVICHKKFLIKQWRKAFKKFLNIECGIVQGPKCNFQKFDVVLAMQQSLNKREYKQDFYNNFSFVIWDETHHIPAETFFYVNSLFNPLYTLGLSATPRNFHPKKQELLFRSIGPIVAIGKLQVDSAKIFKVLWYKSVSRHLYEKYPGSDEISKMKLDQCLAEDNERNRKIALDVANAAKSGRKIIVLSALIDHLQQLMNLVQSYLGDNSELKCGWYVGSLPDPTKTKGRRAMKESEQDKNAEECDILFATYTMTSEGLDIEELDTVFFALPRSDVEQAVGRIRRPLKTKKEQYVIDYCDRLVEEAVSFERSRDRYYNKEGFAIQEISVIPSEDQSWAIARGY